MSALRHRPVLFRRRDIVWIAGLLILAIAGMLCWQPAAGNHAVVRLSGQTVQTISLSRNGSYTFENKGLQLTLQVAQGAIWFSHSDCADGVCINTGKLSRAGDTAVCLPAECSVTVQGDTNPYDGVTY